MKGRVLFDTNGKRQEGELVKVNSKTVIVKLDSGKIIGRKINRDRVEFLKIHIEQKDWIKEQLCQDQEVN